jgi:predicted DsbA family dithiol-disulfide isomerase
MKIEIWSDVVCPFCYIGKRKFEKAIQNFDFKHDLEVEWKSFQLQPDTKTNTQLSVHENLASVKGISVVQAREMGDYVTQSASELGLNYQFDKAIVANTFRSHCFLHLAKKEGKQHEAKELLLNGYFCEGKNIDSEDFLLELAHKLEMDTVDFIKKLNSSSIALEVKNDIQEAAKLGIRGVPFFVFNRKYAISGAQDISVFKQTVIQAYQEWKFQQNESFIQTIQGETCDINENC